MSEPSMTFHLTPVQVWQGQSQREFYEPEAFEQEGFIHCTNGEAQVLDTGNRYYTGDSRAFCLLTVDVGRLTALVKYEDAGRLFPHIYGPLNTDAVVDVRFVVRSADGRFDSINSELPIA